MQMNSAILPLWLRAVVVAGAICLAVGSGLLAYRLYTKPVTLSIAVGSLDNELAKGAALIAGRFVKVNAPVRLNVVKVADVLEAAKIFAEGKVDLAVVRADIGDLSNARAVALVGAGVVVLAAPDGSSIKTIADLRGNTVGVLGSEINHHLVKVLGREYGFGTSVTFKDITSSDAQQAIQSKGVDAILMTAPLTKRNITYLKSLFQRETKTAPGLIAIDAAGAIADAEGAYESFTIPKGTLRGSPPNPDDDLTTLRVGYYLVANSKLSADVVTSLTEALMIARENLVADHSIVSGIAEPDIDPDANIPVHPGAAIYYNDAQQSFMDKYGDDIYLAPMTFGLLASVFAVAWKFLNPISRQQQSATLLALYHLPRQIRVAASEAELARLEEQIDELLKAEIARSAGGGEQTQDLPILASAAQRLDSLIHHRRAVVTRKDS